MWGREILHGNLDTTGGTVWKPLPMLVVTPLPLFGPWAATTGWLWLTRSAALRALVGMARLAFRLGGVAGAVLAPWCCWRLCREACCGSRLANPSG